VTPTGQNPKPNNKLQSESKLWQPIGRGTHVHPVPDLYDLWTFTSLPISATPYSWRSATIGSTRDARCAGT
jgi:hypothetical protein